MSINANNPFLLNLIPTFDVASPSGSTTNEIVTDPSLTAVLTMINTSTNTVYANDIMPFTADGTITVLGIMNVSGTLQVNGFPVGTTTNGSNTILGSNISITSGTSGITLTNTLVSTDPTLQFSTGGNTVLQFDTLGKSEFINDTYFNNNIYVSNNVYCTSVIQTSDERLKQNILPIEGSLSTIRELRGVHYTMDGSPQIGFIAQEVQRILPDAVYKINDTLGVDYSRIIPLLVEAVKELALH
jgi:archaellin